MAALAWVALWSALGGAATPGVWAGPTPAPWSSALEQRLPALLRVYEDLHQHPELSFQEKRSAALLARQLRGLGYTVTTGVGRYDRPGRLAHGVVAVLENGVGPTVLLRADLDALPIAEETGLPYASTAVAKDDTGQEVHVMHACGHDLHMTSLLGTAALLWDSRSQWRGKLVLVGQPAEERGAGARALLDDKLYERFGKPDFALALHVESDNEAGAISVRAGYLMANVDTVDITVRGVGGHGASPHRTKDPVVIAASLVTGLQTLVSRETRPLDPAVVTVGSIHGGSKHNIIPDEVKLQLTVRSYKAEVRRALLEGIARVARGVGVAAGLPEERMPVVTVDEAEVTPALANTPAVIERLLPVWRRLLGAANVRDREPIMGGEDFSRYALDDQSVPSVMFMVGTVNPARHAALKASSQVPSGTHSALYAPDAAPSLRTAISAMTAAALELLARP